MKEALFWNIYNSEKKTVQCLLCPSNCVIKKENFGLCQARKNVDGKLYSLVYGQMTSVSMDPIEKKPLYHFSPGKTILSLGTTGCNFKCPWCQNYEISQSLPLDIPSTYLSPEKAIETAIYYNSFGISYTYNEPLINYEYVLDTSKIAHLHGLKNVLVTNGFLEEKPWQELIPFIDAANIDIKSFSEEFYHKYCKGNLSTVLKNVEIIYEAKKHIELTYLIIPTLNDSFEQIERLSKWIASVSPEIPLHFSRYYPVYKFRIEQTPYSTLQEAEKIAKKYLSFVYLGNVFEQPESNTNCPYCGNLLIKRYGYSTKIVGLKGNKCEKCEKEINIVV